MYACGTIVPVENGYSESNKADENCREGKLIVQEMLSAEHELLD